MAEETLKYKIEIDDTDLARKLAEVRDRIDTSLATPMSNFSMPVEPLAFEATVTENNLVNRLANAFEKIDTDQISAIKDQVTSQLTELGQGSRLAMAKASQDLHELLRATPPIPIPMYPNGAPNEYNQIIHHINNDGFFGTMGNTLFARDWDPSMPLSRREFLRESRGAFLRPDRAGLLANETFQIGASMGVTTLVGARAGGLWGAAAGLAAGVGLNISATKERQADKLAVTLQGMSRSFKSGEFSWDEALDAAHGLQDLERLPNLLVQGIGKNEIQGSVLDFANLGGFEKSQDVDDFVKTSKDLMENVRGVMHALRVTRKEAIEVMREIQRSQIADLGETSEFAFSVGGIGKTFRRDPLELFSTALQGANDLFATAGIAPGTGFDLMMRSRVEAEAMRSTPTGEASIAALGGPAAATQQMLANSLQFYQSPLGIRTLQAMEAGAGFSGMDIMNANYGMTPLQYMGRKFTAPSDAAQYSARELAQRQIFPILGVLNELSLGEGVSREELAGVLMDEFNWDRNTAAAQVDLILTPTEDILTKDILSRLNQQYAEQMEAPTLFEGMKAGAVSAKQVLGDVVFAPGRAAWRGISDYTNQKIEEADDWWLGVSGRERVEVFDEDSSQRSRDITRAAITGRVEGQNNLDTYEISQSVKLLQAMDEEIPVEPGDLVVEQKELAPLIQRIGVNNIANTLDYFGGAMSLQLAPITKEIRDRFMPWGHTRDPMTVTYLEGEEAAKVIDAQDKMGAYLNQADKIKNDEISREMLQLARTELTGITRDSSIIDILDTLETVAPDQVPELIKAAEVMSSEGVRAHGFITREYDDVSSRIMEDPRGKLEQLDKKKDKLRDILAGHFGEEGDDLDKSINRLAADRDERLTERRDDLTDTVIGRFKQLIPFVDRFSPEKIDEAISEYHQMRSETITYQGEEVEVGAVVDLYRSMDYIHAGEQAKSANLRLATEEVKIVQSKKLRDELTEAGFTGKAKEDAAAWVSTLEGGDEMASWGVLQEMFDPIDWSDENKKRLEAVPEFSKLASTSKAMGSAAYEASAKDGFVRTMKTKPVVTSADWYSAEDQAMISHYQGMISSDDVLEQTAGHILKDDFAESKNQVSLDKAQVDYIIERVVSEIKN